MYEKENKKYHFKKSDLEEGMRVEFVNGQTGVVFHDVHGKYILYPLGGYDNINESGSSWDSSLRFRTGEKTINKIYKRPHVRLMMDHEERGELLWYRIETEELTLAEVCKELGREVKIIK